MALGIVIENALLLKFEAHKREVEVDRALSEYGLTLSQVAVLRYLATHGETSIGQVGDALGWSRGNMTSVVDRLVLKNLVTRTHSEDDRRVLYIGLTLKGAELLNIVNEAA